MTQNTNGAGEITRKATQAVCALLAAITYILDHWLAVIAPVAWEAYAGMIAVGLFAHRVPDAALARLIDRWLGKSGK